jgi:NADH-quinone oxidoreductase subunit L
MYMRLFIGPFNRVGAFIADVIDWRFLHDYVHNDVIKRGFDAIADILSRPVDLGVIDGAVNGIGRLTRWASNGLRGVQTGYVRMYAVTLLIGVVFVIVLLLLPLLQAGS